MRKKIICIFTMLGPMVNEIGNADLWVYLLLAAGVTIGMLAIAYYPA